MVPQLSADLRPLRHWCQPQLHQGVHLSLAPLRGRCRQAPTQRRRAPQQRLLARHGLRRDVPHPVLGHGSTGSAPLRRLPHTLLADHHRRPRRAVPGPSL
jgi:hypothetical protein